MPAQRFSLPAAQRLRLQADFVRTHQQGKRLERGAFILNARFDAEAAAGNRPPRFGVVTAKKFLGDAVNRNRARRLFKEIFRLHPEAWTAGWDVVVVPRRSALEKDFAALERNYLGAARAAH